MTPFFITGMPRCRTAWLANLFTTDTTLCLHEPREPVRELVARYPGRRIGVSCASLTFRYRELAQQHPDSRWLYIHREPGQVLNSLMRFLEGKLLTRRQAREMVARHLEAELDLGNSQQVRHAQFDELPRLEVIRQAWEWLLPELAFDEARARSLQGLRVQCVLPAELQGVPLERGLLCR